jgi:integrase
MSLYFSLPKLCDYDGDLSKAWFVWFDIEDPDTGQKSRKQFRGGINYYPDKESRKREGKALAAYWKKRLESGLYNPFNKKGTAGAPGSIEGAIGLVVDLKAKSLKPYSIGVYTRSANMFVAWLKTQRLHSVPLYNLTREHAQNYMDHLMLDKNYNGNSHNTHRAVLHSIFQSIVDRWGAVLKENPFKIKLLPKDIGKNLAYTPGEKEVLIRHFKQYNKRMYYAVNFTYHAYIRKSELCELKVESIDWESSTIRIDSSGAKNRKQESVTITDGLMAVLLEMGLDMAPKHFYIFGRGLETTPEKCTRPEAISERHRRLKKNAGLPDDGKAYYSWKHTGVIDYFKEIKDIYAVMRQCRHSDLKTTMIYLKSLGLNPNTEFRKAQIFL